MKKSTQIPVMATAKMARDLKALSLKTRVSQQSYLREAVEDLLRKYAQKSRVRT